MIFGKKNQRETMLEWPTRQGRAPDPCGHSVRWLVPFFCHKKANIRKEIMSRVQPNRSYGSPAIQKRVEGQHQARRNRERQRDRSYLGGALAPPKPWEPRNRGDTLLPSRRRSRKKKKKGGSLPLSPGGAGTPSGPSSCDHNLHQHLYHLHQHLHHLPPSIYSAPLSRNPLYPLLEHGALCFILLSNDVLPSYDV